MIKALLFDLDGMLLPMATDARAFGVSAWVEAIAPPRGGVHDRLDAGLRQSIAADLTQRDLTRGVDQVLAEVLARETGLAWETAVDLLTAHEHSNPDRLSASGSDLAAPGANTVLRRAVDMGLLLVIAASSLLPRAVVVQRIASAQLDPGLPLALITCAETMHFYARQPVFYEEILARIGMEADEAILVSPDRRGTILPAQQAGLNTFWIGDHPPDGIEPDGYGSLNDFDRRLANGWLATLVPRPHTVEQLIPRLTADVAAAFGLIRDLPPKNWRKRPDPKEWSPLEIARHLRDSERAEQRPRLARIMWEDNPFLTSPKSHEERALMGEDGESVLQAWWAERQLTLDLLANLTPA